MRVGLEKEFFVVTENDVPVALVDDVKLPADECGWLAEARGEPHASIVQAVFSLKASIWEIEQALKRINAARVAKATTEHPAQILKLCDTPIMRISREVRTAAGRVYQKPLIRYQNLHGHTSHRNTPAEAVAGVHISFTEEGRYTTTNGETRTYNKNFDWPRIFVELDKAFRDEIAAARRRPGFYELKHDGRVEYRSLPANVDLEKIIEVLRAIHIAECDHF